MAIHERFFNSDEEKAHIAEFVAKILSDLLSQYKRASEKEFDLSIHYLEFVDPLKKAIHIIHSNFNIPVEILVDDYKWLETYLEVLEFPTIESHLVRISLEFGAWIVFFRDKFSGFLKPKIQKAVKIWKGLFVDRSSEPDDILYLLIEMENLSKSITLPIIELWNSQFTFKPQLKPYSFLMALLMNKNSRLGENLFVGAVRLLEKRLEEMDLEEILQDQNPLIRDANIYKGFLQNEMKSLEENYTKNFQNYLNDKLVATLLLIGVIERHLKSEQKSATVSKDGLIEKFMSSIVSLDLDEEMDEISNLFEQLMLESNISNPLEMIYQIIEKTFNHNQEVIQDLYSEIEKTVHEEKDRIIENGEKNEEIATIIAFQNVFPEIMKIIRHIKSNKAMEQMTEKDERTTQLLLIFVDNFNKIRRHSEGQNKEKLYSAVQALFNNAIINGIPIDLFNEKLSKVLQDEIGVTIEGELGNDLSENTGLVYSSLLKKIKTEIGNIITDSEQK